MTDNTYKIIFINPLTIDVKNLIKATYGMPVLIVFQENLDKAYIVDTGVKTNKHWIKN